MPFERPITIGEAVDNIHKKAYLLPAIQREFVWDPEQVYALFDSLMRDYPIGIFLLWLVEKENSRNFQFYEFIKDYHEYNNRHNPKANLSGNNNIIAVLDGQQRLTALYIGLKGTYAYKVKGKRWDNPTAFPIRKLYLNLLSKANDINLEYDFRFLMEREAKHRDKDTYWFKVGDILDFANEAEVFDYQIRNELTTVPKEKAAFANKTLFKLYSVIRKDFILHYFLEKDEKLDKVLNIFIRVNSGGTPLSYSDLLLSIATAQWKEEDAREEITQFVDEINKIGDGFEFNKDFVLKTCLVLSDFSDIAFKVDNFNRDNMLKIEKMWGDVSMAVRLAVNLVSGYGYNRETLPSNIALIPVAYYLLKKGLAHDFVSSSKFREDRERILKWLTFSLLKRVFSGQPDNVLRPIRQIISEKNSTFPIDEILQRFKGLPKSLIFSEDDIENLFFNKYGGPHTFSVLALLYPTLDFRNKFHQDHIFPKSMFGMRNLIRRGYDKYKTEFYLENFNLIANLQLIEGTPNQEKSDQDFKKWLFSTYSDKAERKEYMKKHYIPDIDLSFDNFENFISERKKLIMSKLKSILAYTSSAVETGNAEDEANSIDTNEDIEAINNPQDAAILNEDDSNKNVDLFNGEKVAALFAPVDGKWIKQASSYFNTGKEKLYFSTNANIKKAISLNIKSVYFKAKGETKIIAKADLIDIITENPVKFRLPGNKGRTGKYYYGFKNLKFLGESIKIVKLKYFGSDNNLPSAVPGACIILDPQ